MQSDETIEANLNEGAAATGGNAAASAFGQTAAPAASVDLQPPRTARPAPVTAPGYQLLREISRGGQAVVFEGLQRSTGRKVAIKVLRDGPLATNTERSRMDREVQALAALNHPDIVQVLDRGVTDQGAYFLVMEYISGRPLDEYLDVYRERHPDRAGDPSELLRLFLRIADAVNAAHLRGIVHRDLKPSNIRVDEDGNPHLLDFGLARGGLMGLSTTPGPDGRPSPEMITISGQFVGSLPWASPEQADGLADKVDARSDVYSLGVILYQILTGQFPYEVVGTMRDVLNNILNAQPLPPSRVVAAKSLGTSKPVRESAAARRRRQRLQSVNPAIEAVVLKALSKNRTERYQSAGEMARDIASYLSGRPTLAAGGRRAQPRRNLALKTATIAGISLGAALATIEGYRLLHSRAGTPSVSQAPAMPAPQIPRHEEATPALAPAVSGPPLADLAASGVLNVTANSGSRQLVLGELGKEVAISSDGSTRTIPPDNISSIAVRGSAATEAIDVAATHLPVRIDAGGGNPTVRLTLSRLQGPVEVDGGSGHTALLADDRNEAAAHAYLVTAEGIMRAGAAPVAYSHLKSIVLEAARDPDPGRNAGRTIHIPSTAAGAETTINAAAGKGAYEVNVGRTPPNISDTLDKILGPLTINRNDGSTLSFCDNGSTTSSRFTINAGSMDRSGSAPMRWTGRGGVQLMTGSAGASIDVNATVAGANLNLYGANGDVPNVVRISPNTRKLEDIHGDMLVWGAADVTVFDNAGPAGKHYLIDRISLRAATGGAIYFESLKSHSAVTIYCAPHAAAVDIKDWEPALPLKLVVGPDTAVNMAPSVQARVITERIK